MGTSEGESKKLPEFAIFDRIDELEKISLELMEETGSTKPTLKNIQILANDAFILAELAFIISFINYCKGSGKSRKYQDVFIDGLQRRGLSGEKVETIYKYLDWVCEGFEKAG